MDEIENFPNTQYTDSIDHREREAPHTERKTMQTWTSNGAGESAENIL